MPALHLATFACDVTPPLGHPLCGGWIEPVRGVDDPLRAVGVVLLGMRRSGRAVCRGLVRHPQRRQPGLAAGAGQGGPHHAGARRRPVRPSAQRPLRRHRGREVARSAPGVAVARPEVLRQVRVGQTADAVQAALAKTVPFTHIGTARRRSSRSPPTAGSSAPTARSSRHPLQRHQGPEGPRRAGGPDRSLAEDAQLLERRQAAGRPALLRHASDELLRRRPGQQRLLRPGPPETAGRRNRRSSRSTSPAAPATSPPASTTTAPRRTAPCCATASTTPCRPPGKRRSGSRSTTGNGAIEPVKLPPRREKTFGDEESRKVLEDAKADQGEARQRGVSAGLAEAASSGRSS